VFVLQPLALTAQHTETAMRMMLLPVLLLVSVGGSACGTWERLPGHMSFKTVLDYEDSKGRVVIPSFEMMTHPVTNATFLAFVTKHPKWRRDTVPSVYAESRYLSHWSGPLTLGPMAVPDQPVTRVSWFAANAFCEAHDARLPTWSEWEYAAAADAVQEDARSNPAWRETILGWYARPSNQPLPNVAQGTANIHGLHDVHGLVWEWVDDFASMLVSADNRDQDNPDRLRFCGAGALSTDDRENYPVLMRIAMLSSLEAADTTGNLGFRCVRDVPEEAP